MYYLTIARHSPIKYLILLTYLLTWSTRAENLHLQELQPDTCTEAFDELLIHLQADLRSRLYLVEQEYRTTELVPMFPGALAKEFASSSCVVENDSWPIAARRRPWLMPTPSTLMVLTPQSPPRRTPHCCTSSVTNCN